MISVYGCRMFKPGIASYTAAIHCVNGRKVLMNDFYMGKIFSVVKAQIRWLRLMLDLTGPQTRSASVRLLT